MARLSRHQYQPGSVGRLIVQCIVILQICLAIAAVLLQYNAKIVWVSLSDAVLEIARLESTTTRALGGQWNGPIQEPGGDAIENC